MKCEVPKEKKYRVLIWVFISVCILHRTLLALNAPVRITRNRFDLPLEFNETNVAVVVDYDYYPYVDGDTFHVYQISSNVEERIETYIANDETWLMLPIPETIEWLLFEGRGLKQVCDAAGYDFEKLRLSAKFDFGYWKYHIVNPKELHPDATQRSGMDLGKITAYEFCIFIPSERLLYRIGYYS